MRISSPDLADLSAITLLFRVYADSLPIHLGYQGFDGELASFPGKTRAAATSAHPLPPVEGEGRVRVERGRTQTKAQAARLGAHFTHAHAAPSP